LQSWIENLQKLVELSRRQLFFVGGVPRSGTTWVQYLLDAHPDLLSRRRSVSEAPCRAYGTARLMAERRTALKSKNNTIFGQFGGFLLPEPQETEALVGTAILLALERQCAGKACRAVGEKTPENLFFFPQLKRLFPSAKFIGIARDPRDVLSSAWHFFRKRQAGAEEAKEKLALIEMALHARC
jgi:hypothetical protein